MTPVADLQGSSELEDVRQQLEFLVERRRLGYFTTADQNRYDDLTARELVLLSDLHIRRVDSADAG